MRVNLLGCGPGWDKAPKKGENGVVWGLNDLFLSRPVDVVIDTHNLKRISKGKETVRRSADLVKKCIKGLKKTGTPCYSTKEVKGIPNIKRYPLEEIINEFDSDYFGSGPDYMLALAIYSGFDEIHTYGVLMVVGEEYYRQKPTFEHWLGVAKGRGIKTVIHDYKGVASILKTPNGILYGFNTPQRWKKWRMENPKEYLEVYS